MADNLSQIAIEKLDNNNFQVWKFRIMNFLMGKGCRNPTLAKCGGEAQHLEKVRIWSPPGLPNV
jgi:hypothetical protein